MTILYIVGFVAIAFLSLRSITKSLKKGAYSYEYAKNEMKSNSNYDNYAFDSRK